MNRLEFENEQIQTIYETLEKVDGENAVSFDIKRTALIMDDSGLSSFNSMEVGYRDADETSMEDLQKGIIEYNKAIHSGDPEQQPIIVEYSINRLRFMVNVLMELLQSEGSNFLVGITEKGNENMYGEFFTVDELEELDTIATAVRMYNMLTYVDEEE